MIVRPGHALTTHFDRQVRALRAGKAGVLNLDSESAEIFGIACNLAKCQRADITEGIDSLLGRCIAWFGRAAVPSRESLHLERVSRRGPQAEQVFLDYQRWVEPLD